MSWKMVALCAPALALVMGQDTKPDLRGTWESDTGRNITFTVTGSADSLHVTESNNGGVFEWTCGTEGKQCDLQGARKGTVSAWYNGPVLVVMQTRGSDVTKERMQLSADKSKLEVEIIPIVPAGKTEKLELAKKQ